MVPPAKISSGPASKPCCDVCAKEMWLLRIEPNRQADGETRVFQCASCTVIRQLPPA